MASVITKTPRSIPIAGLSLSLSLSVSHLHPRFYSLSTTSHSPWTTRRRLEISATRALHTLTKTPGLETSRASSLKMVAENYEAVLKGKYPGKAHAKRVVDLIRKDIPDANGIIYLESQLTRMMEDSDEPEPFRQRRYFYYLTGCNLPDSHFVYDIQSSKSILFIPPINPDDVIWSGLPVSIDEALAKYDVDEVKLTTELNATLAHLGAEYPKSSAFAIAKQVSDHVSFIEFDNKNFDVLKNAIEVSRVVKDEYEIAMLRKANYISGIGHRAVFAKAKAAKNEQELEAAFYERCFAHGCKKMSYDPIAAAGRAAATLHYVGNDAPTEGKLNLLMDAGCEYNNYAADITRTFPLSGKFTKESRHIYETVLKMQKACIDVLKEGVLWDDVHVLAHQIAIDGLLEAGILQGDKDEILKARTSAAFLPHGLGHYLGMDTHDTGGNPNFADKDKLFRYLRVRGKLPAGSVVTVEPGIYFCKFIIDPYLEDPAHSKFINKDVLDKYWDVGGVRIEDNILVTETGHENLTDVPRELEEMEALVSAA